uniref:Uncharacterized protein n=1 Tax=Heterorhabditis bacteriophora TaxID=37862 RepID=A0A1I7XP15_HETBA
MSMPRSILKELCDYVQLFIFILCLKKSFSPFLFY